MTHDDDLLNHSKAKDEDQSTGFHYNVSRNKGMAWHRMFGEESAIQRETWTDRMER